MPWTANTRWSIGGQSAGGFGYFKGLVDDIRLYGSPRTPAQVYVLCEIKLKGDLNDDCIVDMQDIMLMADSWLATSH